MAIPHPSAVRLFAPDHPALAIKLRQRLEERRRDLFERIASSPTWDDFRWNQGRLIGLKDAIEIAEDIEKELTERN